MSGAVYRLVTELRMYCVQFKLKNQILQTENNLLKLRLNPNASINNIIELKEKLKKEARKLRCCILDHGKEYKDVPFDSKVVYNRNIKIEAIMKEIDEEEI